jgi:hypothetical protein
MSYRVTTVIKINSILKKEGTANIWKELFQFPAKIKFFKRFISAVTFFFLNNFQLTPVESSVNHGIWETHVIIFIQVYKINF